MGKRCKRGYVLGVYNPQDCTYKYVRDWSLINTVDYASVFEFPDLALKHYNLMKDWIANDLDGEYQKEFGVKVNICKVFLTTHTTYKFNSKTCSTPQNVRLTKYNYYQKLAGVMNI